MLFSELYNTLRAEGELHL